MSQDTFEELGVPEHVRAHWIDNTEKLRSQITRNTGNLCDPTLAGPPERTRGGGKE